MTTGWYTAFFLIKHANSFFLHIITVITDTSRPLPRFHILESDIGQLPCLDFYNNFCNNTLDKTCGLAYISSSAMRSMVPTPREGRSCCLTATNREGEVVHDGLMTPWVYIYHVWPMFWSFFTASGCFYCSSLSAWFYTEAAAVSKLLTCGHKVFYWVDSNQGGLWRFARPLNDALSPNYDPPVSLQYTCISVFVLPGT